MAQGLVFWAGILNSIGIKTLMNDQLIKILLVEDDEDDYVVTRELLSEVKGWRFVLDWAQSYEAALKKAKEGDHQVYFIDFRLGEHNGLELLREFRLRGADDPAHRPAGPGDRSSGDVDGRGRLS